MTVDEREVFDGGPVVLFKWRNAPGWPVEYASRNVLDVLGYSREDFLEGRVAYSELVHPSDLTRVSGEVQRACEADGLKDFTHEPYRVCRADGTVIWLYDHTHLVRDEAGTITHFHGYVIEMTAHIETREKNFLLEQQLLHAQKLESLGVLAGGLAHDFNNVLTGIMGHTSVARQEELSGPLAETLGRIDGLAQQAADLCAQLLAYSGRGQFVVQPLDLRRVVRDVSGMLQVAVSKKASLQLDLPAALPPILGDRAQLQQIVMNLIGNASDALGQGGGTIRLSLEERELDAAQGADVFPGTDELTPGAYVVLSVADTGCGMSQEAQARLFDPFYSTKVTGRGLGLAAVLGILRGHGGGIRLKSRQGAGTRFDLFFPPCDSEAVAEEPSEPEHADSDLSEVPTGVALLVDDEPVVRRTGRLLLTSLGFDVELAVDGVEALEKVRAAPERYGFVLLDMTMPKLGGRETLRELREILPRLPVILSSGFSRDEAIQSEDDRGALEFLQKPYRVEQLAATIQRLFANAPVD